MANHYSIGWRDDSYRLDRGTLSFWPDARLIAEPDNATDICLTTDNSQFLAFSEQAQCIVDFQIAEEDQCGACRQELERRGYRIWSVAQALATIADSPESDAASALVEALTDWFFIARIPR